MAETSTSSTLRRLDAIRRGLSGAGIDGVIVPSGDPHVSENPPQRWRGRQWLSGFTGSMGVLVVTRDATALFTNQIYELHATRELEGTGIELIIARDDAYASELDWMTGKLPRGASVSADGNVLRLDAARRLATGLDDRGINFLDEIDLLDIAWPDRPSLPAEACFEHLAPFATRSRAEKIKQVREAMTAAGATHHLVSATDDIAWILNLRGRDVPYTPLFTAHLMLSPDGGELFILESKLDDQLTAALAGDNILVRPYAQIKSRLSQLGRDQSLLLDPKRTTWGIVKAVGSGCDLIEAINPSVFFKSRKTGDDLVNYRGTMEEDGAAMCRFYAWLEQALSIGTPVTEVTVHDRLTEERSRGKTFVELSFGTIAGFKGNGAMPHYQASASAHAKLDGDGLLLIDSGGQYLGGTTDVTRTWPIGRATDAMKRDYTLVLKGMIALSRQKFPRETLSTYLDSIARAPIWNAGLDYGHGTGHGVGYFLCVHEGPHTIRKAPGEPQMALHPGMVTSIEPALYRTGKWGIRTENLVVAVECATGEEAEFGSWLEFETLTLCPIDMSLIDESLMRADEIAWLDAYHQTVRERLAPHLQGEALSWLVRRTQPFSAVDFAEAG